MLLDYTNNIIYAKNDGIYLIKTQNGDLTYRESEIDSIVKENEPVKLPYKLGTLGIIKYKVVLDPDKKNKWKCDYKTSKEMGFIVYFDQEFRYRWKWAKWTSKMRGKRWYTFYPCRPASRAIPQALRENKRLDYYEKIY